MPLVIADETLQAAELEPQTALVEFDCQLYAAGRITMPAAERLSGLSRTQFEDELRQRGITSYLVSVDEVRADVQTLQRLGI